MSRRLIGFAVGANNHSGFKNSQEEVVNWAKDIMTKNVNVSAVTLCEEIAVIERATPAVEIKPVNDNLPQAAE